jgi:tetratricopeptide (TPR) repeat protein
MGKNQGENHGHGSERASELLSESERRQLEQLLAEAREDTEAGRLQEAGRKLSQAIRRIPQSVADELELTTRLSTAMGDVLFRRKEYEKTLAALSDAVQLPGGLGTPFLHLRLGQVRFELNQLERAGDELARAYMGGGRKIFEGEDPKYFTLVEKLLLPPPGHDRLP